MSIVIIDLMGDEDDIVYTPPVKNEKDKEKHRPRVDELGLELEIVVPSTTR